MPSKSLSEISVRIFSGGTPSTQCEDYWDGDIPWLSSGETSNRYITKTNAFITASGVENSSTRLAKKNSFVIASAGQGLTRGQTSLLCIDTYINQSLIVIEIDPELANPLYVFFNISTRYEELRSISDGTSSRGSLTTKLIGELQIDLPDRKIQDKIASFISSIDYKINTNQSINDNLLATAKTLFKNSLDEDSISSVIISDICSSVTDGVHNTVEDDPEGSALLLSCKNIKDGQLTIGPNERTISRKTFEKLRKRTKLAIGDILLTSVGTIGETYLILDEPDNIEFQRSVALIKPDPDKVSPEYLYLAINHVKESIINAAHGAVQQCLFINDIGSIEVPLIGKESIERLTNSVRPLFAQISQNRKESQHLANIRDYLLPKLMSGEIDVSTLEIPN